MGRFLAIVAVVVSLATAVLGYLNFSKLTDTRANLAKSEEAVTQGKADLSKSQADHKVTADKLDETTKIKDKAETDLKTAETKIKDTETKLADTQTKLEEKTAEAEKAEESIKTKDAELASLKDSSKGGGSTEKTAAPTEDAIAKIAELEVKTARLQNELTSATNTANALQIKENNRLALKVSNDLVGRVTAVNPAWNFVIFNLGDRQGVVAGTQMLVCRGNTFVGRVRVKTVNLHNSVADIEAGSVRQGLDIQPGDRVIFQANP